jgi:hypothetical protein
VSQPKAWFTHTGHSVSPGNERLVTTTHLRMSRFSKRDKSPMQCAGINRHEAGNERVLRERSSEPLGPEFCVAHREVCDEA